MISRVTVWLLLIQWGFVLSEDSEESTDPPELVQLSKVAGQPELDVTPEVANKTFGQHSSEPVAFTGCGTYKGSAYSENGVKFDEFLGIRYAEPPLGNLRFKNPVPWSGCSKDKHYKATQFCPPCMQPKINALKTHGMMPSEDCLCLNIYRPAGCNPKSRKPVLFYIHGGHFVGGSAAQSDILGGYLAHHGDMIVVTMNYRLGAFGLLSSENKEIPGNQGFFDIVMAAKWVREYIEDFGGDPNAITVSGHGSGGSMVSGFMLNPSVPEDLFCGAMIMSPDFNQQDFIDPYPIAFKKSQAVAKFVGCGKGSEGSLSLTSEQVECLQKADPEALAEASLAIPKDDGNGICSWNQLLPVIKPGKPTVDKRLEKGDFKIGKRVYIGGVPTETYSSFIGVSAETKTDAEEVIEYEIRPIIRDRSRQNIEAIFGYYFGGVNPKDSFEIGKRTTASLNNVCYGCPIYDMDTAFARLNEVYVYYYMYVTSCYRDSKKRKYGAFHGDDIPINFGVPLREKEKYNDHDRAVSMESIKIWSDFVHGRKMKWPAVNGSSHPLTYLRGDSKSNFVQESPFQDICPKLDA